MQHILLCRDRGKTVCQEEDQELDLNVGNHMATTVFHEGREADYFWNVIGQKG